MKKSVRTIIARLYSLTHNGTRHALTATSATDLTEQVQTLTRSKPAVQLARIGWGDDTADLSGAGIRLVAVGQVVREVWRTMPLQATQARSGGDAISATLHPAAASQNVPPVPRKPPLARTAIPAPEATQATTTQNAETTLFDQS